MWLFFLFVAVPIVEIALFIQVGGAIGLWPTLGIVVLTAVIGTVLMRTQGLMAMHQLQNTLHDGGDPSGALVHGALILVAGVLLLTPGFFTDGVGLALLIPPIRVAVIRFASRRMTAKGSVFMSGPGDTAHRPPDGPGTIDGDYQVLDEGETAGPEDGSGWTRRE